MGLELLYNEHAKGMLAAMATAGRIPHALLLEGQPGTGRYTLARKIAQTLLCEEENPPCGRCTPCKKVERDIHPDVITVTRESDSRSGTIKIAQIRQMTSEAYIMPNEGKVKVYILRDADDMNPEAQNAFLKTLEEPPTRCYFILTCRNRSALLATILSRVQLIPLQRLTSQQVGQALIQLRPGHTAQEYQRAIQAGEGAIGPALEALENEGASLAEEALEILALLTQNNEYRLMQALAPYEKDREKFLALLEELKRQVSAQALQGIKAPGKAPNPAIPTLRLFQIADIIEDTAHKVAQNGNRQLLVTLLASRLQSALG